MGVSTIPASGGGGLRPKYVKFTSSGTFTLPDGYGAANPLLIDIQVIGGGGAGSPQVYTSGGYQVTSVFASRENYFGDGTLFQNNLTAQNIATVDVSNNANGRGGGSGGIAKTQMYLTSNLTITVGAAGTKATGATANLNANIAYNNNTQGRFGNREHNNNTGATRTTNQGSGTAALSFALTAGGSGGTSTAGAVSATGGNAATANFTVRLDNANTQLNNSHTSTGGTYSSSIDLGSVGNAGSPAGSAGDAVPLLGALAGGSANTTPVYGAFGVSGKRGDVNTHTGVEGTGGGAGSVGASGAVIITYWA